MVGFVPVNVVEDEQTAMWVGGIPDGGRVIVQGQDFVREGQHVEAVPANATMSGRAQPIANGRSPATVSARSRQQRRLACGQEGEGGHSSPQAPAPADLSPARGAKRRYWHRKRNVDAARSAAEATR